MLALRGVVDILQQGREVILEDISLLVVRVLNAAYPFIAGAEIAARIVGWALFSRYPLNLSLPGPFSSVRGDQYIFTRQWGWSVGLNSINV
jgi:hypothetical protein